jgi:hypothetical protein
MKLYQQRMAALLLSIASSCSLIQCLQADTPVFSYVNRDLILTFRKTGADGGTTSPSDLEIDIGQASLYYSAAPGSSTPVSQYSTSQIGAAFDDFDDLSWAVGGCVPPADPGDANDPNRTLWVTAPRLLDPSIPAAPWVRNSSTTQGTTAGEINSIFAQAAFYSGTEAANSQNNAPSVVTVPVGSGHEAGHFLGNLGNYLNSFQGNVENTTSPTFVTDGIPSRSDFYQLYPDHTGTQPPGTYLGYFELETDGTMNFIAASSATIIPAPTLTATVANGVETISFSTVNNATYSLYYTDSAGLTSPINTWSVVSTNITGNGSVQSFQQATTDTNRFYTVVAN